MTKGIIIKEIILGICWGIGWAVVGEIFDFDGWPAAIISAVTLFYFLNTRYWRGVRDKWWDAEHGR